MPRGGRRRSVKTNARAALPASRLYGLGEAEGEGVAEGEGEAEGDAVGEGEAVGGGEAVRSVVSSVLSGALEGVGGVAAVGSVRSVVRGGGSYGPLSTTESVIPTTAAASATTGVSAITRGTRASGRTHPSKKYHSSTAMTTSTATTSHDGCPNTGSTYPPNALLYQDRGSAGPLTTSGTRPGPCPLPVQGVADIFAETAPQKNKEASADHRPKQMAASHAWEASPSRSAATSILPLTAAHRMARVAHSG